MKCDHKSPVCSPITPFYSIYISFHDSIWFSFMILLFYFSYIYDIMNSIYGNRSYIPSKCRVLCQSWGNHSQWQQWQTQCNRNSEQDLGITTRSGDGPWSPSPKLVCFLFFKIPFYYWLWGNHSQWWQWTQTQCNAGPRNDDEVRGWAPWPIPKNCTFLFKNSVLLLINSIHSSTIGHEAEGLNTPLHHCFNFWGGKGVPTSLNMPILGFLMW